MARSRARRSQGSQPPAPLLQESGNSLQMRQGRDARKQLTAAARSPRRPLQCSSFVRAARPTAARDVCGLNSNWGWRDPKSAHDASAHRASRWLPLTGLHVHHLAEQHALAHPACTAAGAACMDRATPARPRDPGAAIAGGSAHGMGGAWRACGPKARWRKGAVPEQGRDGRFVSRR